MKFREGYKYQLIEPETFYTSVTPPWDIDAPFIRLNRKGMLTLYAGYAWDGASGAIDTQTNIRGSAAHDAFCQLVQGGYLSKAWKDAADREYMKICLADGMNPIRAWAHYLAIKFHNWAETPDKPIIEIGPVSLNIGQGEGA